MLPALAAAQDSRALQLEVILNDAPTQLIGSFVMIDGTRIGATREELRDIGLDPAKAGAPAEHGIVALDDLPGLAYRYDVPAQRIFITVPERLRAARHYDAAGFVEDRPVPRADFGALLNYNVYVAANSEAVWRAYSFSGASASFEARAFSPFGTLSQSAILRSWSFGEVDGLRLDTSFSYSDPDSLIAYRAGDAVTGGLAWTRSVRLGGVQVQRNFGLRPDLVTRPLPSFAGSAAVPSTIDVYVNNLHTFSQDVGSGPFSIVNIPAVSGDGEARVVLRDAAGHETTTSLPFYTSPTLLKRGLVDFSLEGGLPRLSYGTYADAYVERAVASLSTRAGAFDWLTLEGHAEAGAGVWNGGAGMVVGGGAFGAASLALAASRRDGALGFQSYAAYETRLFGIALNASSQRSFGSYDDLASATAQLGPGWTGGRDSIFDVLRFASPDPSFRGDTFALWTNIRPPKVLDRVSVGLPLAFSAASVSMSLIDLKDASGVRSRIVTASASRALPFGASLSATAFTDFGDRRNTGVFVSVSVPLGPSATASTVAYTGQEGRTAGVDAVKPLDLSPGSVGWRVRASEGRFAEQAGAVAYRSSYGWAEAGGANSRHGTSASAQIDGAVATLGNGVFFANRIDDGFAVVDTRVAGVEVFQENRSAGLTDAKGRILLANLRSYQKNKIAIDTRDLPVDADIARTQEIVAPADRAGIRANFAVRTDLKAAILVLRRPDGTPLPVGTTGRVEGGEAFVVGYDGRAYAKGLNADNEAVVALPDGECRASFTYAPKPKEQVVIAPVICH